jgi:hypothetical protein
VIPVFAPAGYASNPFSTITLNVIYLEDEHSCEGGCDMGWDIPEEEEDDE